MNLIGLVNSQIAQDLSCTSAMCVLAQPCGTAGYADLWTYSLLLQFGNETNYVAVNIGSIAVDNSETGMCDLYIQQNAIVILGTLWYQNFVGYWYSNTLSLQVSQYALAGAMITPNAPTMNVPSPFATSSPLNLTISVNAMIATVQANFGFQGLTDFLLSTTNSLFYAYSTDCKTGSLGSSDCSQSPNFATEYFDIKNATVIESLDVTVDGYVL